MPRKPQKRRRRPAGGKPRPGSGKPKRQPELCPCGPLDKLPEDEVAGYFLSRKAMDIMRREGITTRDVEEGRWQGNTEAGARWAKKKAEK